MTRRFLTSYEDYRRGYEDGLKDAEEERKKLEKRSSTLKRRIDGSIDPPPEVSVFGEKE